MREIVQALRWSYSPAARFSMAAAGPASAGFIGLIGFEDRFDSGDLAVAELPGSVLSTSLGHWVEGVIL